ncbi:MAG: 2Fe-2S iron-sulfur cluster binding domain-containing protein, partial [Burkholderiales bacterium]|nr:2Fe-2S iron-sulfur cluster binding domain-containing protein [Burkholderiales bacterium]
GDAPPSRAAPGDAAEAHIRIVRDGLVRTVPYVAGDGSVLAAARRAGLDLPYSCTSGVCGTCRARLQSGQLRMERNFALEPADLAAGFVLSCQAHPLTAEVTLSFDDR